MYGSPWSAPAWMKSNNALNGQVIVFSIIELSDTIMDPTYVSIRVTFFQSITNNGLTIMSSEKRSLTPIYLCPCDHCHHCIYSDFHLIEQQYNLLHIMCCSGTLSFTVNAIPFQNSCTP